MEKKHDFWRLHAAAAFIVNILIVSAWMYITDYFYSQIDVNTSTSYRYLLAYMMIAAVVSWAVLFWLYINFSVKVKNKMEGKGIIPIEKTYLKRFYIMIIIMSAVFFLSAFSVFLFDNRNVFFSSDFTMLKKVLLAIQYSPLGLRICFMNLYMNLTMLLEKRIREKAREEEEGGYFGPSENIADDHVASGIALTVLPIAVWAVVCSNIWMV